RLAQDHDRKLSVVSTHQECDDGTIYGSHLRDLAVQMDLDLRFFPVPVSTEPVPVGFPTLADAYAAADLVCYPSLVEGFGNALLEAVYYLRPVLVNRYPIYVSDIAPCGFNFLEIENGRIRTETVDQAEEWLEDPSSWAELVERNYQIASEHFSFRILRERVLPLLG
ncbi:MAG: glycosyltransferase, partial [Candidatus Dormibacteraceae bacterium]